MTSGYRLPPLSTYRYSRWYPTQGLATTVRTLRLARGLTQGELARRGGLDPAMVSMIERGLAVPNPMLRECLAHALGVSVAQLDEGERPHA